MVMARLIGGLVALSLMGTAALGFQETRGGAASGAQAAPQPEAKALDLGSEGAAPSRSSGTEVRIPGLGKLGVLPKLDFGLELLYGVNEDKRLETERAQPDASEDGVQIRGSVKHRF